MSNTDNTQNAVATTATQIDSNMSRFLDMVQGLGNKTADFIAKSWDYAEVQLTETVRQFLVWEFASACIMAVVSLIALIACWRIGRSQAKSWRVEYKNEYSIIDPDRDYDHTSFVTLASSSSGRFFFSTILCIIFFYASNVFIVNIQKGAKIALAPRIYLIEYGVQKYKEIKSPTK